METSTTTIISPNVDKSSPPSDDFGSKLGMTVRVARKRPLDGISEEERREERKAANRKSAYQSRLRKKLLIEELQGKVTALTSSLKGLREENHTLSLRLESALSENRRLRFLQHQALVGVGGSLGVRAGGSGTSRQARHVALGLPATSLQALASGRQF